MKKTMSDEIGLPPEKLVNIQNPSVQQKEKGGVKMTKEKFLEIQEKIWDISPSYPDELSKEKWLEICSKFYDENSELFSLTPQDNML